MPCFSSGWRGQYPYTHLRESACILDALYPLHMCPHDHNKDGCAHALAKPACSICPMRLALSHLKSPLELLIRYQPCQITVREPVVEELFQALVHKTFMSMHTIYRR